MIISLDTTKKVFEVARKNSKIIRVTNENINEPAIMFKHLLSHGSYTLLNKLILDYKSRLSPEDRIYHKKDNHALIYNLFKGDYKYSLNQYKEIFKVLCNENL